MATNLKEKLKFLLNEKGLTMKEICELSDMNRGYFSATIQKDNYNQQFIEGIVLAIPDIDLNWFLKDDQPKVLKEYEEKVFKNYELKVLRHYRNVENEKEKNVDMSIVSEPGTSYTAIDEASKKLEIADLKKKILDLFEDLEK